MDYITLDYIDLGIAAVLLLVSAGLTLVLKLGVTRSLLVNAVRMMAQLTLIGLILKGLFATESAWLTGAAVVVMVSFGAYEINTRQSTHFRGLWGYGLGGGSLFFAGLMITGLALMTQIRPDPWYDPQYVIPILGMVLGNTMTGIALGLDRLLNDAGRERVAIEAQLAMGHSIAQAMREPVRGAMRAGLMPMINAMASAGVVYLPGMMTGQILAGVEPVDAVKYQILIFLLIAGATAIGVIGAVFVAQNLLTDDRHRLRLDRLRSRG